MTPTAWIVAAYRAPSAPSTARVATWRGLHELGAVFLGPGVCVVPQTIAQSRQFVAIGRRLTEAGGSLEQFNVTSFSAETEAELRKRYNAARDDAYRAVSQRAVDLVREMTDEIARGEVSFGRLERHEVNLVRLRRALRKEAARDLFDARGRLGAAAAVDQAGGRLESFARDAVGQAGLRRFGEERPGWETVVGRLEDEDLVAERRVS